MKLRHAHPSLGRRLVFTLMLAFGLVLLVLMGKDYLEFTQQPSLGQQLSENLGPLLGVVEDPASAARLTQQLEQRIQQTNRRHAPFYLALLDAQGALVYHDPAEPAQATLRAQGYQIQTTPAGPWQLRLAQPPLPSTTLLELLVEDLGPYLLIAFPCILLPLMLAVHLGLRPLRQLAAHLDQRSGEDFSPLPPALSYQEVQPMLGAFNGLLARLGQQRQREQAFIHDAAHELRTPLAVISAQAHLLARAENVAERSAAQAGLENALQRAAHLSHQLLTLARLEQAPPTPPAQAWDAAALAQQLLAQAFPRAEAQGQQLALEAPDSLPVRFPQAAFHSILQNLLDNALHYTPAGSQIQIRLEAQANTLRLTVADDGPGIPEALRSKLFERFVRGAGLHTPGSGLGLAIVQEAARQLGGNVQLGPGLEGRGAGFVLTLPAAPI